MGHFRWSVICLTSVLIEVKQLTLKIYLERNSHKYSMKTSCPLNFYSRSHVPIVTETCLRINDYISGNYIHKNISRIG